MEALPGEGSFGFEFGILALIRSLKETLAASVVLSLCSREAMILLISSTSRDRPSIIIIKDYNYLYKRFIRSASVQNNTLYKNYKNKLNHLIRIAKRMYYEQQLSNAKSNIKLTWKILNRIINKNNSKSKISDIFYL